MSAKEAIQLNVQNCLSITLLVSYWYQRNVGPIKTKIQFSKYEEEMKVQHYSLLEGYYDKQMCNSFHWTPATEDGIPLVGFPDSETKNLSFRDKNDIMTILLSEISHFKYIYQINNYYNNKQLQNLSNLLIYIYRVIFNDITGEKALDYKDIEEAFKKQLEDEWIFPLFYRNLDIGQTRGGNDDLINLNNILTLILRIKYIIGFDNVDYRLKILLLKLYSETNYFLESDEERPNILKEFIKRPDILEFCDLYSISNISIFVNTLEYPEYDFFVSNPNKYLSFIKKVINGIDKIVFDLQITEDEMKKLYHNDNKTKWDFYKKILEIYGFTVDDLKCVLFPLKHCIRYRSLFSSPNQGKYYPARLFSSITLSEADKFIELYESIDKIIPLIDLVEIDKDDDLVV